MKCLSCNVTLNDEESLYTFEYGEHIDLCQDCLSTTDIKAFPGNLENLIDEVDYAGN